MPCVGAVLYVPAAQGGQADRAGCRKVVHVCRAITCVLAGGAVRTYDPAFSDSVIKAEFEERCGAPDSLGFALTQPCSPNKCASSPWSVGPWSSCSANCVADVDSVPPSGVLSGLRSRTVACFDAARQCAGTRPDEFSPCTVICDACAALAPCGAAGSCRCAGLSHQACTVIGAGARCAGAPAEAILLMFAAALQQRFRRQGRSVGHLYVQERLQRREVRSDRCVPRCAVHDKHWQGAVLSSWPPPGPRRRLLRRRRCARQERALLHRPCRCMWRVQWRRHRV